MGKKKHAKYVQPDSTDVVWALLADARKFHPHLEEAQITVAYRKDWRADKDGIRTLGKCKKVSAVEKIFHGFDFVIVLNHDIWVSDMLDAKKKLAILDHELCHAQVKLTEDDEPIVDHNGKPEYRCRKHDLEEFREIVERHGLYKADIVAFVRVALERTQQPLLTDAKEA